MFDLELIPFLAALGYLMGFSLTSLVRVFILAAELSRWLPVACTLIHIEVKPQVGGVELSGLGSTGGYTNQIVVTYKYKVKGIEYTGRRVNVLDAACFFGMPHIVNYDKELWETLSNCFRTNKSVPGWVSPSNPRQSILTKRIYYGKLSLLVFIFLTASAGLFYFTNQYFFLW